MSGTPSYGKGILLYFLLLFHNSSCMHVTVTQQIQMPEDPLFSPLDGRKTLSLREVARALGLDTETIRRDARTGIIPGGFQRKPGGQWRFKRKDLEEWWAKQGKRK